MERILNVAEKNDAAKNLSNILSNGNSVRREGFSKFNKIYEFPLNFQGRQSQMLMTSVSGHLLTYAFSGMYKYWKSCSPIELFEAPLSKVCIENMENIKKTLEFEVRKCTTLIIWTDCDREGENIGYEIINVCVAVKPSITILRARFSEITHLSINTAIQNLGPPNKFKNDAVNVRSELDLRIGAAFTRFQTLRLQQAFPQVLSNTVISYGSCQFPTLGFVVERYKAIQSFIQEPFWKIKVTHEYLKSVVEFTWKRNRLFNELACQILFEKCQDNPKATVKQVLTKEKSKWRPLPLDTVELEKLGSVKLHLNAKETMRIAEKLYIEGYISYPRTETNIFPKDLNLVPLIEMQTRNDEWGDFASRVIADGPNPRYGKKSDEAHPPIHPTKYASNLHGNEQRVYEYIVRHFLACVSKDAKGFETIVEIDINYEVFTARGLIILERNYLEVYPYDRWSDKEIPNYEENQLFEPSSIDMISGETSPPNLLTEADLIALMEKHGIGTDATHAEHIETVKARSYVGLDGNKFIPGTLGMGLVEGYDSMGFEMSKPFLRAGLETDLQKICDGNKDPRIVLQTQVRNYKNILEASMEQSKKIEEALALLLNEPAQHVEISFYNNEQNMAKVMNCPKCKNKIVVNNTNGKCRLGCIGYPECKLTLWFPSTVQDIKVSDQICMQCSGYPKKIDFTFTPRAFAPFLPNHYIGCVGGCESLLMEMLNFTPFPSHNPALQSNQNTQMNPVQSQGKSTVQKIRPTAMVISNKKQVTRKEGNVKGDREGPAIRLNMKKDGNNKDPENSVQCHCGTDAKRLTVQKECQNKGRKFYTCEKSRESQCGFFEWDDDAKSQSNKQKNNDNKRKKENTGTRKCGICGETGHNRKNCPRK